MVEERVKVRFEQIKSGLGLLRREIQQKDDRVTTKDFEYAIWAEQDEDNPDQALLYEMLSGVSAEALGGNSLNDLFAHSFDEMRLSLPKEINVERVIDAIEALKSKEIRVEYDPDCEECLITVNGQKAEMRVTTTSVTVYVSGKMSPFELVEALSDTSNRAAQLAGPSVLLFA